MVEADGATPLVGERGAVTLLDVFKGRPHRLLLHVAHAPPGAGAVRGVHTWVASQIRELSYIHSRDVTYPCSAKAPTKRAPGTANSWAGRRLGTRLRTRSTPCLLDARWA